MLLNKLVLLDVRNTKKNQNKLKKQTICIIYTVNELSKEQINKLEESVTKKLNKKVELSNVIDPSIIGGIKIVVNDTVFDNSIVRRLESLKQELINGKDAK